MDQFVNMLLGLKVTTILRIQDNSDVFFKHPVPEQKEGLFLYGAQATNSIPFHPPQDHEVPV